VTRDQRLTVPTSWSSASHRTLDYEQPSLPSIRQPIMIEASERSTG
jgi:hypothetical protein